MEEGDGGLAADADRVGGYERLTRAAMGALGAVFGVAEIGGAAGIDVEAGGRCQGGGSAWAAAQVA